MKVLNSAQMREVDRLSTEQCGIPSLVLMENAGSAVVREMKVHFGDLRKLRIAILCGKGNNGGDGFVVARHLMMEGIRSKVLLFASPAEVKGDARVNLEILQKSGAAIQVVDDSDVTEERLKQVFGDLVQFDVVVDGLLGTGIRPPVSGFLERVIRNLQRCRRVVAIDIPSGLECDAFAEPEGALAATSELTVTFTAPKPAHVFSSGDGPIRRWVVVPIGSPATLVDTASHWLNVFVEAEAIETLRRFKRIAASHKGSYGHVLVIAGSLGKTGAASLTARSALLAGAGLVTLATPVSCLPIVASHTLEVMTEPLEATDSGGVSTKAFDYGKMDRLLTGKDVLALGPGLGTHAETVEFVRRLVSESTVPVVLDADAINAFAGHSDLLDGRARMLLLTPHPGEFARLIGRSTGEILADRAGLVRAFALERQVHLILKGHRTLYASPSGQMFVNPTGNPGMATGGSGDVLTGVLGGILAQALLFPEAATDSSLDFVEQTVALAIYLHGLAGDLSRQSRGEQSLLASDIMDNLSKAFLSLRATQESDRV
jgi:NAD(P)H-hydrate epimerase